MPGTPVTPRILCPHDGARDLDRRRMQPVRWTPFIPGDAGTTATADAAPSGVLEAGTATWTNPGYLTTGNGTQAQMASAAAKGYQNIAAYSAVAFGVSGRVAGLSLVLSALGSWPAAIGHGDAYVRAIVAYKGEVVGTLDSLSDTAYVGGATAAPETGTLSIFAFFEAILGENFTVAQLEVLIGDPADFRVIVQSVVGSGSEVTAWYVGKMPLRVTYYTANADTQGAYQLEVYSDSGLTALVYDTDKVAVSSSRDRHFIPPGALPAGDVYCRVRVWNQPASNLATSWSATVSATYASDLVAQVAHGLLGFTLLVELELARRIGAALCERAPNDLSFTYTHVHRFDSFDFDEPLTHVFIRDVLVDGRPASMVEVLTPQLVDSTAGSWHVDTHGWRSDDPRIVRNMFYVRMADSKAPGCSGESHGAGLSLLMVVPLATNAVVSGPRMNVPYLPLIIGTPRFGSAIDDVAGGKRRTVSGGIVVKNASLDTADDGTGQLALRRPAFWRLIQSAVPNPSPSLSILNAGVRIRLLPDGARYSEAATLFAGELKHESGNLLSGGDVRFGVLPTSTFQEQAVLAAEKIDKLQWPNCAAGAEGKTIGEAWGAGLKGLKAHLVDVGAAGTRTAKLLVPGLSAVAANGVLDNGQPTTLAWTFSAATGLVTFTSTLAPHLATIAAGDWTVNGDGPSLNDYAGVPSATLRAGTLALAWLGRMTTAARIATTNIHALDDPALGGQTHAVRAYFDSETLVRTALERLQVTRQVYFAERGDRFEAVPMWPTDWDAHSAILGEADVEGDPASFLEDEHVARTVSVEYQGDDGLVATYAINDYPGAEATLRDQGTRTVQTYHATRAGAIWVAGQLRQGEALVGMKLNARHEGHMLRVGSVIALELPDGLDEASGGALTAARLWQIRAIEGRALTLRRAALLTAKQRAA